MRAIEATTLLNAVSAYVDVVRDQAVLQLTVNNEQVIRRQLDATQDRFRVGEVTRTDVAQAQSRLAQSTAQRVTAEGNLQASRGTFQRVIGTYPGQLQSPTPKLDLSATRDEAIAGAPSEAAEAAYERARESALRHA